MTNIKRTIERKGKKNVKLSDLNLNQKKILKHAIRSKGNVSLTVKDDAEKLVVFGFLRRSGVEKRRDVDDSFYNSYKYVITDDGINWSFEHFKEKLT